MNTFEIKIGNNLFQTYFIECTQPNTKEDFLQFLLSQNIQIYANPNVLNEVYESFTIDNVRTLNAHHNEKSSNIGKKIFIIEALTINHEAHNALLKMFEEPTEDTHFFFLIPRVDTLPDTLKSRAHLIYEDHKENILGKELAIEFVTKSPSERMEIITGIIAKNKNTETSAPLRDEARRLLDACEYVIRENTKIIDKDSAWKLSELIKAKKYLSTPGASVKMILEHIALIV
ncbi:MAG: polymerase subunit delta [Patescibacteria group bacterium]|nr:polymerase subunit delta [Patescibacteria group bacterium]